MWVLFWIESRRYSILTFSDVISNNSTFYISSYLGGKCLPLRMINFVSFSKNRILSSFKKVCFRPGQSYVLYIPLCGLYNSILNCKIIMVITWQQGKKLTMWSVVIKRRVLLIGFDNVKFYNQLMSTFTVQTSGLLLPFSVKRVANN